MFNVKMGTLKFIVITKIRKIYFSKIFEGKIEIIHLLEFN